MWPFHRAENKELKEAVAQLIIRRGQLEAQLRSQYLKEIKLKAELAESRRDAAELRQALSITGWIER